MLSKYFTRLAAGAAAAMTLSGCMGDPALTTAVPESNKNTSASTAEPLTNPYTAIFTPVYDVIGCADKYPATVSADTPSKELKKAFNRAANDKMKQICLWAAFDPYKDVPRAQRNSIDVMRLLTSDQFKAQLHFEKKFEAPEDYKAWEKERMEEALAAITAHPKVQAAFENWKHPADYENRQDALDQYRMKLDTMQLVSDLIRESFGFKPVPVKMYGFEFAMYNVLGFFTANENAIHINYTNHKGASSSFGRAMEVIAEEAKHSVDVAMADIYRKGRMDASDVRAEHAAAIMLNSKVYIGRHIAWRFPITADPLNYLLTLGDPVFDAYKKQYSERNAKEYSSALTGDIMQKLNCDSGNHPVKCVISTALNVL